MAGARRRAGHLAGRRELESAVDRLALLVLVDGAAEVQIGDRRYRLSLEKVFRLEECSGGFVYFLRNAGALRRRVRSLCGRLPGGGQGRVRAWAVPHPGN